MIRVLFVCLGNICRSPLAEAIFNDKVKKLGIDDSFMAHSCGTANYHVGEAPDPRTISNAKKNGITINHIGRQVQEVDLDNYDFIFVMDKSNLANVLRLKNAERNKHKIFMLRDFDPVKGEEVPDPYYGAERDFQNVFEILNRSVEGAINFLRKKN